MTRNALIKLDACFLAVMSLFGLVADLLSHFRGIGPFGTTFLNNPQAIGVVEAHGLALIASVGMLLGRNERGMHHHATLAAMHLLLGTANIVFFDVFAALEAQQFGLAVTAVHFLFAAAQIAAAAQSRGFRPRDDDLVQ